MARHETTIGDSERWLSVIAGGMLTLSSLRRRDVGLGALFALGGAALVFRGIVGHDGLFEAAGAVLSRELDRGGDEGYTEDEIDEALLESFPASDPPSWTPTAGADVDADGLAEGSGADTGDGDDADGSEDED
jgi:hypothetical protein